MGHRISPTRVFLLAALTFLALAGTASAYQFTLVTPIPHQQQVQRAISFQVNRQVSKHWTVDPVSFAAGGIPITFENAQQLAVDCKDSDATGCHLWDGEHAWIEIRIHDWQSEADAISHEIIETETDMHLDRYLNGHLAEISDPAPGTYRLLGVWVSDFVFPRWFYGVPSTGPWDQTRDTRRSLPAGL